MDDPVERALIRALAMFCAALTALALLALTQSCRSSMHSAECVVHNDTARVESSRSWQRVVETVAQWEADSIVVEKETASTETIPASAPIGTRITIYRPRLDSRASTNETASDSLAMTQSSTQESKSETTATTKRGFDWWGIIAIGVLAVLLWPALKKIFYSWLK